MEVGVRPPLVIADDGEELDRVLAVAASAGVGVDIARTPDARWRSAPLVVLTVAAAGRCAGQPPPSRAGVVLMAGPADADDPAVWRLATEIGADHVITLPAAEDWLAGRLVRCGPERPAGALIAVLGACGGAGASVLATALAVTAARHGPALLVDADRLGGGLDLMAGLESASGLRWPDLAGSAGRLPADSLLPALPGRDRLAVLSWDRGTPVELGAPAMAAVLSTGRATGGVVVADLPRERDEAAAVALRSAEHVLLIVPATVRAIAAAGRSIAELDGRCADLQLVVRGPAPSGLRGRDVQAALGRAPLLTLRPEPGLAGALERGEAPGTRRGPLATACKDLLRQLVGTGSVAA